MLARIAKPNMTHPSEFDRQVNRLFENFWGGPGVTEMVECRVDVHEDRDHVYFEAEVPGLKKDEVSITLEDGVLSIEGEKKYAHEEKKEGCYLSERRFGQFRRSFRLPSAVDEQKVDATLKDGLLKITLNKREEVKPRKIEVKGG